MKIFFFLLSCCFLMVCAEVSAQPTTMLPMQDGYAVATCFSGTYAGQNLTMPVVLVMNVRNANIYAPVGANWSYAGLRYMDNQWAAQFLGEVFGIATNNAGDIFVTATSVYGGPTSTTNYIWGPGGPGGVYRINGTTGAVTVFKILPNTNSTSQPYASLGNICYDSKRNQFFVTNLDDGKIYRLDGVTGNILSTFDPFSPDGGTPGFCPLGERLWGIGYYNDSIYFCRWNQDGGNTSGSPNQIWSVGLAPSGAFVGTEHLDFNIPPYPGSAFSHPVSDIEFSQNGNMLLAERVWYGTTTNPLLPGPNLGGWAHQARLLEYHRVASVWTPFPYLTFATQKYQVGTFNNHTNSSGGCDYGYEKYDSVKGMVVDCDSSVWVSGDALHFGSGPPDPQIYGFQRFSQVGGNAASGTALSMFVDANNNTSDVNKNQIGDIDIFKHCGVQGCPPHSITVQAIAGNGTKECCYKLTIKDSLGGYTALSADVTDPLVMITGVGTTGLTGWGTSNTGMTGTWTPPGGTIPTGTTDGLILCLTTLTSPPITIVFTWYGADGSRCTDSIKFDCARVPPPFPPCITINSSNIICANTSATGNTYQWTFTFTNNSPFSCPPYNQPAGNISISSATMGVNVSPNFQNLIPPIGCGGTSLPITVTISGMDAKPGEAVCIVFHLKGVLIDSNGNCQWSCPCDTICFTLPKCKDCCEGFKKIISTASLTQSLTTNLNILASAGPAPIIHASATLVSAQIKRNPGPHCSATPWTPVSGYFTAPLQSTWGSAPFLPLISPAVPTPAELQYGTVPSGVSLSASPLLLTMQFPPPPANIWGCTDSLQFCIRYSFTDTNCVTCDTLICYQMRRSGVIFHQSGGLSDSLILNVPIPVGTEAGTPVVLDPDIPNFAKLRMTDQSNGSLTITVPLLGGIPENEMTVVGLAMRASAGVRVTSLNAIKAIDEVGQIKTTIAAGSQKSFPAVFDNYTKQNSFTCDVGIQIVLAGNPKDTLEFGERVLALAPGVKGGDVIGKDSSLAVKNVRTFALFLANGNQSKLPISSVKITAPADQQILAIGPPQDSQKNTISLARDHAGRSYIFQSAPKDMISLSGGEAFRPIYITVAGGSGKPVTLGYATMDADGNTLTEDSVTLLDPLSVVHKQDPPAMRTSAYLLPPFPNPAATTISFQVHLDVSDIVTVSVADVLGKEVGRVVSGERLNAGDNVFIFPTAELSGGTYYVTLHSSSGDDTKAFKVIR